MSDYKTKLSTLRQEMSSNSIDALIIPQTDTCDIAPYCGLDTSAGYVVVTQDKAAVLIDGRYSVQAKEQVDTSVFDIAYYTDILPEDWAAKHMPKNGVLGFDPWLHTHKEIKRISDKKIAIQSCDTIIEKKSSPHAKAIPHELQFAGATTIEKIKLVAKECQNKTLITESDSMAWILNLRDLSDPQSPGIKGCAIIDPATHIMDVYTDTDCSAFYGSGVRFYLINDFKNNGQCVDIDIDSPFYYKGNVIDIDPCALAKSIKNETEQNGIRAAHVRDARAVIDVIQWVKTTPNLSEKDIAEKLISRRAQNNLFRGTSFDSIVGWNENGAKIHGSPTETIIEGNGLLLIDSGGQYDDGTTDITRTIAVGKPSDDMREKYTLVLKAHIALATAIFPVGTTGIQLDAICRAPLWAAGIDFAHGTGHGVGYFLNVHEGPCGISPRAGEPLFEGQFLSNEPGYYREGAFGIRLENLMLVQKYKDKSDPTNQTGKDLLCFETVTKVPFDDDCIVYKMLNETERSWLDAYHKACV